MTPLRKNMMKKMIGVKNTFPFCFTALLFTLLNWSSSNVNAQTYYFMNDSATWKIDWFGYDINCQGHCFAWEYYLTGDTVINSHSFKKLGIKYHNIMAQSYSQQDRGAIRQDTINKKVYYVSLFQNDTTQWLLYDFDLNTGDTIPVSYLYQYGPFPLVDSINYVLIGNENHKRFWITNVYGYAVYFIEGVGSNGGLIESLTGYLESQEFLTCFEAGDNVLFSAIDTSYYGCDVNIPLSTETIENAGGLLLFPNHATTDVTLQIQSGEPVKIECYNSFGEKVFEKEISADQKVITIPLSNFALGIYLCQVHTGSGLLTKKIIKSE